MKIRGALACILVFGAARSSIGEVAQPVPTTDFRAVEAGPNYAVRQRTVQETLLPSGKTIQRLHSYTEIGSGLNKLNEAGQWVEASDTIEIINGAGVARGAQHQVIFDPNIRTAGSIDLLTPDGKRLRSHILALNWYDSQQDKNVQIAETKDC